jgi:RNA polymerase sigma-70 factor (sigma-E family)
MRDDDRVRQRAGTEAQVDFDAFVVGSSGRLLRVAQLLTGDRGRAEDLVQDAYAKAFLRWDKIRADDPWAYVRRCVVNGYTDWWRRRPWREQPTERLPEPTRHPDPAAGLVDRDALMLALAQLTRRERAVVVLRFYQDLSEAQIAYALRIAPGTVKSTNLRAMRKLRGSAHLQPEPLKGQQ